MRILAALAALGGAVLLAPSVVAQNTIRYVAIPSPSGPPGADNGQSWGDAYSTLERALDPAINMDIGAGNVEIRIKQGTYRPNGDLAFPVGSTVAREAAFVVPDGVVRIRGKWAGSEGPLDPPTGSATILSGDIGALSDMSDNCYHVLVFDENSISQPRLEG